MLYGSTPNDEVLAVASGKKPSLAVAAELMVDVQGWFRLISWFIILIHYVYIYPIYNPLRSTINHH